MSEYKVPVTKILSVIPHSNAERLEIVTVYNFQVIVPKDKYKQDSVIIYVPIDSILPQKIEEKIFPVGSKVKLHKSRVRQIKLRADSKCKYKGVSRKGNKYCARIQVSVNKRIFLGSFDTQEQAAIAYNKAAKEFFGKFAKFNEIK